jgi:putative ABC transport system permease protein
LLQLALGMLALIITGTFLLLGLHYPHLRRMAWRNVWAHKQSAALTILGLTVSTALISITVIESQSMNNSVDSYIESRYGKIAYDMHAAGQAELTTSYLDESSLHAIHQEQSGGTLPVVAYTPTVVRKNDMGKIEIIEPRVHTIGVEREAAVRFDPELREVFPSQLQPDEAILSERAATALDVREGDVIYILDTGNIEHRMTVKQVAKEQGLTGYPGTQHADTTILVSLETGRKLMAIHEPVYTNLLLSNAAPAGWHALPVRAEAEESLRDAIGMLTVIFGITSINAVIIGLVLITNIFKFIAEERRQEMGVLRAVGLGKSDLRRLLTMEGLLFGAISGVSGVLFGWMTAYGLIQLLSNTLRSAFPISKAMFELRFDPGAALTSYAIGLLIVYICVRMIARSAARVSIIDALQVRPDNKDRGDRRSMLQLWLSIIAGVAILSFVAVTAVQDIRREWITDDRMPIVFLAVLLTVPMLILVTVQWLPIVMEGIIRLFRNSASMTLVLRLALRSMSINRFRTGLLLFMFAAISCFVSLPVIYNHAMEESMNQQNPLRLTGGHELVARDQRTLYTERIMRRIRELPAQEAPDRDAFALSAVHQLTWKESVGEWGSFSFKVNGIDSSFAASNDIPLTRRDSRFASDREAWEALAMSRDAVILSEDALMQFYGHAYKIGDSFTVQVGERSVEKRIIAIAGLVGYHPESYGIWISQETIHALAKDADEIHTTIFVNVADASDRTTAIQIEMALTLMNVNPVTDIVESESGWYRMLIFIIGLMQRFNLAALGIGMIGLIVVMYRLVRQRRQQLGLLRAIGVSPGMIMRSILLEGVGIGVIGISLGFAVGTYMSYIVFDTLLGADLGVPLTLPFGEIGANFLLSIALSVLFAYLPARKVLRVSPIEATRYTV